MTIPQASIYFVGLSFSAAVLWKFFQWAANYAVQAMENRFKR